MPRKPTPKQSEQREIEAFAERYDTLAGIFRDPVEFMFDLMSNPTMPPELRLSAAKTLTEFRYPKLKAIENKAPQQGPVMQFNINLTQAAPKLEDKSEIVINPPLQLVKKAP
jgi:hypothetical protein